MDSSSATGKPEDGSIADVERIGLATLEGITAMQARTRSLQVDKARLQGEVALQSAAIAGLEAQKHALREELARVAPDSELLRTDGNYEDGSPRDRSDVLYEKAYDKAIGRLGLPGEPSSYRTRKAAKAA